MVIHWHTEAPEAHLLTQFVAASLAAACGGKEAQDLVIHSWGPSPAAAVRYATYPAYEPDPPAMADSWFALRKLAPADLGVVVRSVTETTAALSAGVGEQYPEALRATWSWVEGQPPFPEASSRQPSVPHLLLRPRLTERKPAAPCLSRGLVGIAVEGASDAERERWRGRVRRLRRIFPHLSFRFLLDPEAILAGWNEWLSEQDPESSLRPPRVDPGDCETIVFGSGSMRWASCVLEALDAQRAVIAPEAASYASFLAEGRGSTYPAERNEGEIEAALIECFGRLEWDPAQQEAYRRRAGAWARRWTPNRCGTALLGLLRSLPEVVPRSSAPTRWLLRREYGVGDVIFTLSVAWALKERDPDCRVTLHTESRHATWARWFECVDAVTEESSAPRRESESEISSGTSLPAPPGTAHWRWGN